MVDTRYRCKYTVAYAWCNDDALLSQRFFAGDAGSIAGGKGLTTERRIGLRPKMSPIRGNHGPFIWFELELRSFGPTGKKR